MLWMVHSEQVASFELDRLRLILRKEAAMPDSNKQNNRSRKEWISRDSIFTALGMKDVLDHYGIMHGSGDSYRIHCPFHDDDRPSCSINEPKKIFNCFACGEQGNVLDFIGGMEGFDPKKDFRKILEKAVLIMGHNPTPERRSRQSQSADTKKQEAEEETPQTKPVKAKVKKPKSKRKTKPETAKAKPTKEKNDKTLDLEPNRVLGAPAFPLKLDPSHPWLVDRLAAIGLTTDDAKELGIGYETRSNALMAGRVCFPIHNAEGELVAYSGRWASDDVDDRGLFVDSKGRDQDRYKLPKDFRKQLELYNFHRVLENRTRSAAPDNGALVIVEGFWSSLRLSFLTIPVVALMGHTMSEAQIGLLKRHRFSNLVLMLDGDKQGRKASDHLMAVLSRDFFVKVIDLEEGIKPDSVDEGFLLDLRDQLQSPTETRPSNQINENQEQPSNLNPFGSFGHSYVIRSEGVTDQSHPQS